jgi:hypothetical protein
MWLTAITSAWRRKICEALTPRKRIYLEKPTVTQQVKKFPAFYITQRLITVFTRACHWLLYIYAFRAECNISALNYFKSFLLWWSGKWITYSNCITSHLWYRLMYVKVYFFFSCIDHHMLLCTGQEDTSFQDSKIRYRYLYLYFSGQLEFHNITTFIIYKLAFHRKISLHMQSK